jgi:hypothetical protein
MLINMTFSYPTKPGKKHTRELDLEFSSPAWLIDSNISFCDDFGHPAWFGTNRKVTEGIPKLASKLPQED